MSKGKPRLALIVEDSRMTRKVVREMLEELGFTVAEAGSVEEARRWVENMRQAPDLALLDWGLPDGAGLVLIREWRKLPAMRSTQLLMLTIRSERTAIEAALAAGADEFLMKPCTVEALEAKLALLEFSSPIARSGVARRLQVARHDRRRVLIVDDSPIARRAIQMALEDRPDIEVIGVAVDGRAAIERVLADDPDVVILDLEMPELDGLDVLRELRICSPHTAVVVFSTHTTRGAGVTVEALLLGARDCLRKPVNMSSFQDSLVWIRDELSRRIEGITARPHARAPRVLTPVGADVSPRLSPGPVQRPRIVVVAASTGGPLILRELLSELPATLPVPVVIVQHLPPDFIEPFARQLGKSIALPVALAHEGVEPSAGHVYLAPGGAHLSLRREHEAVRFVREQGPRLGGCRPAADILFAAAAEVYGPRCLALVLSGMGSDGCEGARALVDAGSAVFAQDQATSPVWGMPGSVVRSGLASKIVPIEAMPAALLAALEVSCA